MSMIDAAGSFRLGSRSVRRLGYGAMQLAGPGVFGPPRDRDTALAVLRSAVESGVNHIDTSDFYGPHVTNQLIREALRPYPTISSLSQRSGRAAAQMPPGTRPSRPRNLSGPSTIICAISRSTRSKSSICA